MEKIYNVSIIPIISGLETDINDAKDLKIKEDDLVTSLLEYMVERRDALKPQTEIHFEIDSRFVNLYDGMLGFIESMAGTKYYLNPCIAFGGLPLRASGIINEDWAIVLLDELDGGENRRWKFAFKSASLGSSYNFVSIPDGFKIYGGSLTGYGYYFPAFEPPWPWPILDPHKYSGIGKLRYLLRLDDANPLTTLIRSKQPYKGLAMQIVGELKIILDNLADVYDSHKDID